MVGDPPEQSTLRQSHRLVEHYTPDGMLGRLLLASVTGTLSGGAFLLAVFGLASFGFVWFLTGVLAAGVGVVAALLTILTLWPVYLSLIGNIESPERYGRAGPPSTMAAKRADDTDPSEILKRKYAAGELSDEEFERRLDTLLNADEITRRGSDGENAASKRTLRERN
ncbi:SHOCT domain-containing protein [Haloprofundus salinisoli]|uniref:SHOCT domain-containing protein n=1 Tax=Haloprofundus salinisoli TaxID=2876193 RepID=UPI001CC9E09C|nr:SHOCT domain-containing protein [Haloprofundus salinisoli]